jgi:hypothetical protein
MRWSAIEAGERQVKVARLQLRQLRAQKIEVPIRLLVAAIVHQPISLDLCIGQIAGNVNRDLLHFELPSRAPPDVPHGDNALRVDHDRLPPAELRDAGRNLVDGSLGDLARVLGIRDDLFDIPPFNIECHRTIAFPSLYL